MDKKKIGLLGAITALTPLAAGAAPAAPTLTEVMSPASYAELLQPIPNAAELLKEASVPAPEPEASVQLAQYYGSPYYPNYNYAPPRRRYYHHHHHHHHHHHNNYGGYGGRGGYGGYGGWGPY
jgi:hypothetical protein